MSEHHHEHSHNITEMKGINLLFVVMLNFIITIAQIIGGILSGSLSLISDALHNFSDGISLIISYIAIRLSKKDNDIKRTFGYKRATILAALINSSFLIVIAVFLFKEAYTRLIHPQSIDGGLVVWVALVGLVANFIGVLILRKNAKNDMNLKSSYLHLISDTLSSVGVIVGGILIYFFKIYWVDPLLTALIGLFVMKESYEIVKNALHILMQGAPKHLDINEIAKELESLSEVENVHHIHLWSMDEKDIVFQAHIHIKDMLVSETKALLEQIEHLLLHHNINHTTIQFENNCCEDVEVIKKDNCKNREG